MNVCHFCEHYRYCKLILDRCGRYLTIEQAVLIIHTYSFRKLKIEFCYRPMICRRYQNDVKDDIQSWLEEEGNPLGGVRGDTRKNEGEDLEAKEGRTRIRRTWRREALVKRGLEATFAQIQFVITLLEPEWDFISFFLPTWWRSVPFVEYLVLRLKTQFLKGHLHLGNISFYSLSERKPSPAAPVKEWLHVWMTRNIPAYICLHFKVREVIV